MVGIESLIALLAGGLFGGGSGGSGGNEVTQGLMEQILQQQKERLLIQNPLYERANQLAMSLMPKSANVANPVLYDPYNPGAGQSYPRDPRLPPENRRVPTDQGPNPGDTDRISQAVRMMASGIAPMQQAKLFRR